MKNLLFVAVAIMMSGVAMAGVKITETEQITIVEKLSFTAPRVQKSVSRPCAKKVAEPVLVKTHTEIVDHYQVYQPVTQYQMVGTQVRRRVVPAKPCGKCGA